MDMLKEFDAILKRAMDFGKEKYPNAPVEHHAAFANSVAYAMTGMSGGYGGPSMREHWASRIIISSFGVGLNRCSFEQAVDAVEECCFGELTYEIALMSRCEHCFDDPEADLAEAEHLLLSV